MFSLPFLSRRAHDQVVHRRLIPLCLVTALLSTSQPSLRRLSSSVWLSTTHCKPDLSLSKLPPTIPKQPLQSHMAALQCKVTKLCNGPPPCKIRIHVVNSHVRPKGVPPSQVNVPCPHGQLALQQGTSFCTTQKVLLLGHLGHRSKCLPPLRAHINPWPAPHWMVPDHRCNQRQPWAPKPGLDKVRTSPPLNAHLSFGICLVRPHFTRRTVRATFRARFRTPCTMVAALFLDTPPWVTSTRTIP